MAKLVLVPTPIGNLGDMTLRAIETLRSAEIVAAEDTRHSGKLLRHFGIDTPLKRLDAHTIARQGAGVLEAHSPVAFVTDAGTPGISDPGADLLRLALERGHSVEVLPGPTAFVPALILSGLPADRFVFEGFLPRKGNERKERLRAISDSRRTTILFEAPGRLVATLRDLVDHCGMGRPASVSRELTKLHEETVRGGLADLAERFGGGVVKGEIAIVVGPASKAAKAQEADAWADQAAALARAGLDGKTLQRALTELGAPRNLAYELAMIDRKSR